jgi:hypothetical protein
MLKLLQLGVVLQSLAAVLSPLLSAVSPMSAQNQNQIVIRVLLEFDSSCFLFPEHPGFDWNRLHKNA